MTAWKCTKKVWCMCRVAFFANENQLLFWRSRCFRPRRILKPGFYMSGKSQTVWDFTVSRRVPDFCNGWRSFPTNEDSNLYRRGRRRWNSLITNPLNCWAPVPLSHINIASLGQTAGDYPIHRQNLVNSRSPGIFSTYKNQAKRWCYTSTIRNDDF